MILNIPNIITFFRILTVPLIVYLTHIGNLKFVCFLIFLASFTDWLDGYIARKYNMYSRLGEILDPVSDRIYILALIYIVYFLNLMPIVLILLLLFRETLLTSILAYLKTRGITGLPVHYLGKMGSFCLLIGFPGLIFSVTFLETKTLWLTIGWSFMIWGVFLYFFSTYKYLIQARNILLQYA